MGPMLQRLLEERFHLKIRSEVRESAVYLMTVAKGGPTLKVTGEDSCDPAGAPKIRTLSWPFRAGSPGAGFSDLRSRTGRTSRWMRGVLAWILLPGSS